MSEANTLIGFFLGMIVSTMSLWLWAILVPQHIERKWKGRYLRLRRAADALLRDAVIIDDWGMFQAWVSTDVIPFLDTNDE